MAKRVIQPKGSKKELTEVIRASGVKLASLTPTQGFPLMLQFYDEVRAEDCDLESDGDMLLYQWGVYEDLDGGKSLHVDITQQFIVSDEDGDDAMSQLSLTFFYKPPEKFKALKDGNKWCSLPKELKAFRKFIESTPAYQKVANLKADDVKIQYSRI
jgi:hypothetical protein